MIKVFQGKVTLISLPIRVKDRELDEMGLDSEENEVELTIRADQISEAFMNHDVTNGEEIVTMYLMNGNCYSIYMEYAAFYALWKSALTPPNEDFAVKN